MPTTPTNAAAVEPGALPDVDDLARRLPQYEIQTLLGRGGMGAVYRARHRHLDRLVAIKVLIPDLRSDPSFDERFAREAKALARLDHPGIVRVHDFGVADGVYYLVMEFVDGANLRDLLAQGRLGSRDVLTLIPQVCGALQYAHDAGVVHRDIKPENILVDTDGHARIADFGLAKLMHGDTPGAVTLTHTHQNLGTPHYMAPEQLTRQPARVDHRSDIYSLGVVIYEMLTGELPIGRFAPPSAKSSDGSDAIDAVVMRSLESEPDARYQQVRHVAEELDRCHDQPSDAADPNAPTPSRRRSRLRRRRAPISDTPRRYTPWIGASLVLVACVAPWFALREHQFYVHRGNVEGIPFLALVMLVAIAIGIRVHRHRRDTDSFAWPLVCLAVAFAAMLLTVLVCVSHDDADVGFGLLLASIGTGQLLVTEYLEFREARRLRDNSSRRARAVSRAERPSP